jgi:hypothetical protein
VTLATINQAIAEIRDVLRNPRTFPNNLLMRFPDAVLMELDRLYRLREAYEAAIDAIRDKEEETTPLALRPTCLFCVSKHLAQALVLMTESVTDEDYVIHRYIAVGHLAEAEAESVYEFPSLASKIRDTRCAIMLQDNAIRKATPLLDLLKEVRAIAERYNIVPDKEAVRGFLNPQE